MGNPRLPNEIKKARGTMNVTRDGGRIEMLLNDRIITIPPCPDFFNQYQASEWQTVWSYLIQYKLAAPVDLSLIVSYCIEMGKYLQLVREMNGEYTLTNPKGYIVENPLNRVANNALTTALKLAAEFGFTPVSRSRITIPKKETEKADDITSLIDG